jgi:hypothetical protein
MKHLRLLGLLFIGAHGLLAVLHLLLTTTALPAMAHVALGTAIALITAAHLVVLLAWWFLPQRVAGVLLFVLFATALAFGSYEHFFSAGPNNILRMPSADSVTAFRVSSVLLFLLQASGCVLAFRSARIPPTTHAM